MVGYVFGYIEAFNLNICTSEEIDKINSKLNSQSIIIQPLNYGCKKENIRNWKGRILEFYGTID